MRKLIYYFFFLFFILTFLSSGVIDSQDGFQYLAVARNIYYKGKPTAPPYEYKERKNVHLSTYIGKDGNSYSPTGLGFSLALLPAVAITDVVYKIYGVSPSVYFPLENDWLIFLNVSFINTFFGAFLGVILFIYLQKLNLTSKQAFFISLTTMFATNLLVYTKHSWPHLMFTTFLVLTFLLIKLYSDIKKKKLLYFAGASFGVMSITYNQTFFLTVPALILYYYILMKPPFKISGLRNILSHSLFFLLGLIPFILIYMWFEHIRQSLTNSSQASVSFLTSYATSRLTTTPPTILIEGLFGQLFSPGRSIFIYSPILLIIVFFWHKIKKVVFPELVIFLTLSIVYIFFYGMQFSIGAPDQGLTPLWHGESSWGPRYLIPLIPFGVLIAGHIYTNLQKKVRFFIFYPLVILGIYINLLGILMPYQIKFHDLETSFFINNTEFKNFTYSNFLPRYSVPVMMSKKLVKNLSFYPKTSDHGIYNVKFYDGIDLPFNVGPERWRVVEGKGYISFDNNKDNPVKGITFGLINHPITEASESAKVQFVLNNTRLLEKPYQLKVAQRELIKLPINQDLVKPKDNQLMIEVDYGNQEIITQKKQILGLQSFDINDQRQNMESIDVPYVSSLGPKMAKVTYQNWGGTNQDPWRLWDLHTQTYERLPDFWWIRNLYYWDIPKGWIIIPLIFNLVGILFFGYKTILLLRNKTF